jgi:hypothetical protein
MFVVFAATDWLDAASRQAQPDVVFGAFPVADKFLTCIAAGIGASAAPDVFVVSSSGREIAISHCVNGWR